MLKNVKIVCSVGFFILARYKHTAGISGNQVNKS